MSYINYTEIFFNGIVYLAIITSYYCEILTQTSFIQNETYIIQIWCKCLCKSQFRNVVPTNTIVHVEHEEHIEYENPLNLIMDS